MNDTTERNRCMTGCWLMAGAIGLVIFVMMTVLSEMAVASALLGGLIITGVLGLLLTWILCRPVETEQEAPSAAPVKPAPAPSAPAAPAPAPAAPAPAPATPAPAAPAAAIQPPVTPPAPAAPPATAPVVTAPAAPVAAPAVAPEATPAKAAPAAPPPTAAAPVAEAPEAAAGGRRPAGLAAPRNGAADDLKVIEGIGPVLEQRLNDWGIWHFDQIAAWGPEEVAYADQNVPRFKGRASRDKWVAQCRIIVSEGVPAFLERAKTNDY